MIPECNIQEGIQSVSLDSGFRRNDDNRRKPLERTHGVS
jgi:hypothetical protein